MNGEPAMHHLTDRELLLEADGEMDSASQLQAVRDHLAQCGDCRDRQAQLTGAMDLLRATLSAEEPPKPHSEQVLSRIRQADRRAWWQPAAWCALAASLALAAFVGIPDRRELPLTPRHEITPGATVAITREQVCEAVDRDEPVLVEQAVAERIFAEYGIRNPKPRAYELDYLITPALGGARDARNLWPQPYGGGEWNARVKDALEDRLRQMVCEGTMDIETAQRDLSRDWIAAYKRLFQTDRPLLAHLTFAKDRPWGD